MPGPALPGGGRGGCPDRDGTTLMQAGSRQLGSVLGLLLVLGACGCRSNTNQQLLENELRARDFQYREVLDELTRSEAQSDALRRELAAVRQGSDLPTEIAGQVFGLRRIVLGRGTGGIDDDRVPGDEKLVVMLEPRDADDDVIKVPGKVLVTVLQIDPQGLKIPLCSWEVGPEALRQSWKQGLLSTGYSLTFPFKNAPQFENLRVVVRLILPDGRLFEADKDVKVRLMPGQPRVQAVPLDPLPAEELPRPQPIPPPEAPAGEPPAPAPPQPSAEKIDPFLLPSGGTDRPGAVVVPASAWQPAVPHGGDIRLGRPLPLSEGP